MQETEAAVQKLLFKYKKKEINGVNYDDIPSEKEKMEKTLAK
jgi:hypothetical protein